MPANTRVTIRDIAQKAGLHFTTVSLALRNSPRLKEPTRVRIQNLAKEMGYVPDPMLAALNAYRQKKQAVHYQATIAWIHTWPNPKNLYNCEEFNQYYQGACERARERGYVVEEFWLKQPGMSVDKLHRILRARNIQGALLAPQPESNTYLDLRYEELSAVAFGYSMQPPVLDLITNHHVHTMTLLLKKLLALGYRRIGLCMPEAWDSKVENAWQSTMLLFQEEHPDFVRIPTLWMSWKDDEKEIPSWVKKYKPDAVVSFNEAYEQFTGAGIQIPEDVGFGSLFIGRNDNFLSGVYQNDRLIGCKAIDMVIDMLHRGETGLPESPVRVLVEGVWRPGKTLKDMTGGVSRAKSKKTGPRKLQVARS